MTIFTGVKTRGGRSRCSVARAALFFLWIIFIFSQFGLHFAVHEEAGHQYFRSPPRKARFFDTASFHAPSSSVGNEGDPDTLYGDDKRIVHTGPNPLHN
ncbi:Clavata3/esr-related 16, putative [Theobroma cacao]|uniref:Clavata3/esr-related 16, putative n=1 Tax=Theobroma cacao TaxID=3641 RepID=A0A061E9D9_THECC|nr:Clavata3/esr-related 16, putative [Theobroma cacao]